MGEHVTSPKPYVASLPRNAYCHTCGRLVKVGEKPNDGYKSSLWMHANGSKPEDFYSGQMPSNYSDASWQVVRHPGTCIEQNPTLLVDVNIWRNGGRGDHLCSDCIELALRELRKYIDRLIGPDQTDDSNHEGVSNG